MSQLRRINLYALSAILLGLVLWASYVLVLKPKLASAADPYVAPYCSIRHISTNGTAATFYIDLNGTDFINGPTAGQTGAFRSPYGSTTGWALPTGGSGGEGYHTYHFSISGPKTIRGAILGGAVGAGVGIVDECSRSYTHPQPNQQALAWITNINCSATTGALTFTANVSDPDGGTPGYYLSIQNIGDTGWIYAANGSYGWGPWYPPRNGATYTISIWAADAQTGGVVGPGVYNYSCSVPPSPPTCSLSVNPALIPPNTSSTLTWSSANATSFSVDQGVGALSPVGGGSRSVSPGQTSKTYTGTVTGPGGSANCTTTLTVGSIGCTLNSIAAIEPGETYTPSVTVSYVGGAANVTANVTVTANANTSTYSMPATSVPGNISLTVSTAPPILFPVVGSFPVTSTTSGVVNGAAYGPINCNTAALVVSVVHKSYFKVFGGGATVGAGFNSGSTTCTATGAGRVSAYASSTPTFHGSSTQYDLKALAPVADTFYSSGGRQPATPNFKALTLANNAASGTYGGGFGGTTCITDYYSTTKQTGITSSSGLVGNISTIDGLAGASNQIESTTGATITGGSLSAGGKLVVYVTGDVYISGNITIASTYNSINEIPFFALVVKGNIKIAPGVTQLEGLYIAQPNGAAGGTIYTCLNVDNSVPNLFVSCGSKLTFNGSVVAKSIKLMRTAGTLISAGANETYSSNNAAEVFNALPELFIANPAFKIDDTTTELYDSVTSLPPLL